MGDLASGGAYAPVHVWDAKTGATLLTYNKQGTISIVHALAVGSLAWSPDGTTVQIWQAK